MYQAAQRIARRFEPLMAKAFLAAVQDVILDIDIVALESAMASGNIRLIRAAIASGGNFAAKLVATQRMDRIMLRTLLAAGDASTVILNDALNGNLVFNRLSPRALWFARTQAGNLIADISASTLEAVRFTVALGQAGVTVVEQARIIREVVGLMPQHVSAPFNLGEELRNGRISSGRRLSAADYAEARSRIAAGTVDDEFIAKMQTRYAASLRNYRALTIARTESLRSSYEGLHESWRQAIRADLLPKTSRRFIVVTLDDRLRDTHAQVPLMNPDGRGMEELFDTPFGALFSPPWEPNCRCGVTLLFPGRPGLTL
jgi:hypothetical protein